MAESEATEWARRTVGEDIHDWIRAPEVLLMPGAAGTPSFVSVSADGHGPCNEPSFHLWALWELRGTTSRPELVLRNQPDRWMHLVPSAMADVDGDGRPELLFKHFHDQAAGNASGQPQRLENGLVRAFGEDYVDVDGLENPSFVCPC
jgi:hypothetical protein